MADITYQNYALPTIDQHTQKQKIIRFTFCAYWLYFYGVRNLFESRILDYIGMFLLFTGLLLLISAKQWTIKAGMWVLIFLSPLILATIIYPNRDTIYFVFKTFIVALFFVLYFKSLRLTIIETICFVIPVILSIYFFFYPRPSDAWLLAQGRMSGISEPNFTSLSLIISMCGAFGIYWIKETKRSLITTAIILCICVLGIVMTGSRAGFIGMLISIGLFLLINKKTRYAILAIGFVFAIIGSNQLWYFLNDLLPFQRIQNIFYTYDPIMTISSERSFTELSFYIIQSGEWFIGGGPQLMSEWSKNTGLPVPHNSLLDIGLSFGKFCFYFYSFLIVLLLLVNIKFLILKVRRNDYQNMDILVTSIYFVSLFPMYLSLSAGLQMDFVLWMVLGTYPLLHSVRKVDVAEKYYYS